MDTKNTEWLKKLNNISKNIDNPVIAKDKMFAIKSYVDTVDKEVLKAVFFYIYRK